MYYICCQINPRFTSSQLNRYSSPQLNTRAAPFWCKLWCNLEGLVYSYCTVRLGRVRDTWFSTYCKKYLYFLLLVPRKIKGKSRAEPDIPWSALNITYILYTNMTTTKLQKRQHTIKITINTSASRIQITPSPHNQDYVLYSSKSFTTIR